MAWATRNHPKRAGKKSKTHTLVATCGSTAPGPEHVKVRTRVVDSQEMKTTYKTACPTLVGEYFDAAKVIDVHNHYRQGGLGLERAVHTKDWAFRLFCTLIGIIETDAYLAYCHDHRNDGDDVLSHGQFTRALIRLLFNNPYKQGHLRLRKRMRESGDDENKAPGDNPIHSMRSLSQSLYYVQKYGLDAKGPQKDAHPCQRRCVICGKKCSFYCERCSKDSADASQCNFVALCGASTGRSCFITHCQDADD